MKLRRLLGVYLLLGLVMLAFTVSIILSFSNLRKYEQLANGEIIDSTWVIYQAEIELVRFLYTLDLYVYGEESLASREDVIERMEIFWSRLPLFLEGSDGRRLAKIGNTQEAASAALDVMTRMEPLVLSLERGDIEGFSKIRADLHALLEPLNRTLLDARQWQEGAAAIRSERLDRGYMELLLASLGILLSGGCLFLLLLHEIREARRAQAAEMRALSRLSDAIESFSDGFVLFDSQDRLVSCNEALRKMTGAAPGALDPGTPFEVIVRRGVEAGAIPEAIGQEDEWIKRRIRLHRNPAQPIEIRHASGRWFRITERRTNDGGSVSVWTDITSLKEHQEELSTRQKQADTANKAKTDFLPTMSHELRTPLNAIMGFSEVMKQQLRGPLGDERYVDYASDIYDSAKHLLAVINNILDISRIEAGRLELDEQAVVIEEEIDKALRLLAGEAEKAGIELIRDVDDDLPLLLGDAHKIQQIVINLVANAIRYMRDAGQVTVSAFRDQAGGMVLSVRDDGAGMAREDVERVVSPFVRLSNPLVRQHDGTGLGLPLVKAMVELHGGRFELTSELGKGTTGTATFPKSRVIQAEIPLVEKGTAE